MSSENLNEEVIHQGPEDEEVMKHIDDESQECVENIAPKAQEESLIINQDGDSSPTHEADSQNIVETSDELIDEGISNENELISEDLNETNDQDIDLTDNKEDDIDHVEEEIHDIEENEPIHVEKEEMRDETENQVEESDKKVENVEDEITEESNESEKFVEESQEPEQKTEEIQEAEEHVEEIHEPEENIKESHETEEHIEDEVKEEHSEEVKVENVLKEESQPEEDKMDEVDDTDKYSVDVDNHLENNVPKSNGVHHFTEEVPEKNQSEEKGLESKKSKDIKALSTSYNTEDSVNADCEICNKTVYPLEKVSANNHIYHKQCFRCHKCRCALLAGNFSFNNDKPYCRPHYIELFKKRGRYDEIDDGEATTQQTNISDIITDELPAQDITKNLVAKFRDLEAGSGSATISSTNSDELPAPNTTKNLMERFTALGKDADKFDQKRKPMIEIPRSEGSNENNGSCENEPQSLPKDVVRANEPGQDDLPEQGITKNLVNRFRDMETTGVASK